MKLIALAIFTMFAINLVSESQAQTLLPAATPAPPMLASPLLAPSNPSLKMKSEDRCVQHKSREVSDEIKSNAHLAGPALLSASYFAPAGAFFSAALDEPFSSEARYFGYAERQDNKKIFSYLEGGAIRATRISDDDPLVKSGLVESSATLLTLHLEDSLGGLWNKVNLYVWICDLSTGRPKYISELTMRASSPVYGAIVIWPAIILIYVLAAVATKATDIRNVRWYRYLDPVYMTAGSDGKGSLSKLQILFFSMIVFGLLSYIVARTGVLSNLSSSVLLLLGIAGVGSAAAKGTDQKKNSLSTENQLWLIRKGWLPAAGWAAVNNANWHEIITNDGGEFDVYRYQSCIFSLTVGGALLTSGVNGLASFTIPDTLLGVLGLSQAVYITGKLVSTTSVGELNNTINDLRAVEKKFSDASLANVDPNPAAGGAPLDVAVRRAGQSTYIDYLNKAKDARILFVSLTSRSITDAQLQPTLN